MSDPLDGTLVEARAALMAGGTTAAALAEGSVARARAWQPWINAFVKLDPDGARAAAALADARLADRRATPRLAGVPLAHKDMFYRIGRVSTCGSRIRREWAAETTGGVLQRLDAAGAVETGTLNMAEFAYGPTGHNEHLGDARNPWNPEHITGGSSSGSAAAVAARIVFGALGSDTGGSIRLPASFCGVTGLKPTWGRVPRHGAMPLSHTLDTVGPIARSAADCAALLQTIAGRDHHDPGSSDEPVPDYMDALARAARGLRIGFSRALIHEAHHEVAQAALDALDAFRRLGMEVRETQAPDLEGLSAHCMTIMQVEAASLHGPWLRVRPEEYESQTRARLEAGFAIPAPLYVDALRFRAVALARFCAASLDRIDAFLLPTVPVRVPTLAETGAGGGPNMAKTLGELTRFTRWVNYLGVPAISVPCGFDSRRLPIGVQLVARPFAEATLLRLGHAYQAITDWHRRAPTPRK